MVRSSNSTKTPIEPASGIRFEIGDCSRIPSKTKPKEDTDVELFVTLEYVPSNAHSCQGESQLYIFQQIEAAIKKDNQGKKPAMRHVSRTHRVVFDWLFDRINFDSKIQIRYASHFSQCCTTDYKHMRGSSRKFGVRTSHSMSHLHALMLCV